MPSQNPINPIFKLQFFDLYENAGLVEIDRYFTQFLTDNNQELAKQYSAARKAPEAMNAKEQSGLIIAVAEVLEDFLTLFFNIQINNNQLAKQHQDLANLYIAKRFFIQRRVAKNLKTYQEQDLADKSFIQKFQNFEWENCKNLADFEMKLANKIAFCLKDEIKNQQDLEQIEQYCAWVLLNKNGSLRHKNGILFQFPKKIDPENLLEVKITKDGSKKSAQTKLNDRDGFKLTDFGYNLSQTLDQANYCIYCHNQGKDSCRSGLKINSQQEQKFKLDQFQNELSGCPLDEKISEMNWLKAQGKSIAALATAIIDNPMIAGTGHRICNDCMKSCIYQKQQPVNIPQIETRTLKDVLSLPFGFEIYSLLTRWNPLNFTNILPKEPSGYKVLVAGLGPAGYTLAHYLLNQGHLVVAVDGLKIEPLNPELSGINLQGERFNFKPIKNIEDIYEPLEERTVGGFGGVAEYGITARWDKNFLKIIRLLLERRQNFRMFGGFRLGSGLDCYDALKEYDFDHVALCIGAGWAKIPEIKNNFLKGIRVASDFLMALQLTGAAKENLLSNLQLRLPIAVIGGGLTAFDTACEALAYYPVQVKNFAHKYKVLCLKLGKDQLERGWNEEEKSISQEFLEHHQLIKTAKSQGKSVTKLLQMLGGAKIIYRKTLKDCPAYQLNHEEVEKALEEGIEFVENTTATEAVDNGFGQIKALKISENQTKDSNLTKEIKVKTLFLATGTTPNKAPFYEDKLKFSLDGGTFQIIDLLGQKLPAFASPKSEGIGFICAKNDQGKMVSFFGDLHPSFGGSVVKAMASAKNGYSIINQALKCQPIEEKDPNKIITKYQNFLSGINQNFTVKVQEVNILSNYFTQLVVYAPLLAQKTKLGHIFRLHNYHQFSANQGEILMAMEGVAVTTYLVSPEQNTITVMIVNCGSSSAMVKNLKVGEPIIFMGPTGTPAHNFKDKTIVLIAGGRGIFPLAGLAAEYKKNNCYVILFCGFKQQQDLIKKEELENSCHQLVLAFNNFDSDSQQIITSRPDDLIVKGNVVEAVVKFFNNQNKICALEEFTKKRTIQRKIDVILTMGNEQMMHQVAKIYHQDLKEYLSECAVGITSLNSPMQCMLKGVCSQCLQRKIDPKTGNEKLFYACLGQDQKLGEIDFKFLQNRCGQNSLTEKLSKIWLEN